MTDFDDLRARLVEMDARQETWRKAFVEAYRKLRRERFGRWRRPDPAADEDLALQARKLAGEAQARELFAFLDTLCDAYCSEALPQNRAKLRADVGAAETLLIENWAYARQNAELVRNAKDGEHLRRALAAVSLDDLRADSEEVDDLLARIWLAAVRAGLDPRAAFAAAAALSNPGMGGGGAFLQQHLRAFEGSAAYRAQVLPALRRQTA